MHQNHGAARDGLALLAGILRCGQCGDKIYVSYKKLSALYYCDGGAEKTTRGCLAFGSSLIDRCVSAELLRAVEPIGIEASLRAQELKRAEQSAELEHARLGVEAARYQALRAFEQFDLVDPKNRLVADTLEQRLNAKLADVNEAQSRLDSLSLDAAPARDEQIARLRRLAEDLPALWNHPRADATLKKRVLRAAIQEVLVVHHADISRLELTIHWKGGVHTRLSLKKRVTPVGRKTDPELLELVTALARDRTDAEIARILNMKKIRSPHDQTWTRDRVKNFRAYHRLGSPKEQSGQDQNLSMSDAATYLGISRNGLLGLERLGAISRNQTTDFAPWSVSKAELDSERVQRLVGHLKRCGRLPKGGCPEGQTDLFDS